MPARSEAQRRYLNWKFGHAWVKEHGFDTAGKLPARVKPKAKAKAKAKRKPAARSKKRGKR